MYDARFVSLYLKESIHVYTKYNSFKICHMALKQTALESYNLLCKRPYV